MLGSPVARSLAMSARLAGPAPAFARFAAAAATRPCRPSSDFQSFFFSKRSLSDSLRSQIKQAVKENDVVVFMKGNKDAPQCGFSRAVVQILQLQGVKNFKTVNVLADSEIREGVKEYTSWPTVPQVFVKGEFIGGCDILLSMHQNGELETLLEQNGIVREGQDQ